MLGRELMASFGRIAAANGSRLELLSESDTAVRFGYTAGTDAACESGVCVLPHFELQQMMREWMARRRPEVTVTVVPTGQQGASAAGD